MNRDGWIPGLLVFGAFALGVAYCAACGSSTPTPAQQAGVAKDTIDQTLCVYGPEAGIGAAEMRAEIDACKDAVRARRDGGAQ